MIGVSELSTEKVMRVAKARFTEFSSQRFIDPSILSHSSGSGYFNLLDEEIKGVELVHLLLATAEKVGNQQFDLASKLLYQCQRLSSSTGNAVQRVVYHFASALQERIDRETGRITSERSESKERQQLYPEEPIMSLNPALMACFKELPFYQVTQFAGIQAITESVATARKVHLIDLGIRSGARWTVLMQSLASRKKCPLELLKITAVGTASKQNIEETGKRLADFAETMNLPFSFKIAMVSDIKDIKEDIFELTAGEVIAVYSPFLLRHIKAQQDCLESPIRVLRNLNPCVMVVAEIDANLNLPSFMDRFIEALSYYSAFFDCLEVCMDRSNPNRMAIEEKYLSQEIQNIVATEGEERLFRHMKTDAWRAFLKRFGIMEKELSMSSLYQAILLLKNFACGSSCTFEMKGKCLTVGWKGTPILSISVWKFHPEGEERRI